MSKQPLCGKKVCVIVENKFIPEEIQAYRMGFGVLGIEVEFVSRIWYGDYKPTSQVFYSDVDPLDDLPWESPHRLEVKRDIGTVKVDEYAAVIMSANYTSVRLRYADLPRDSSTFDATKHVRTPPAVQFFAAAMKLKSIVKGALCHGLWVLTPNPELIRGRTVTCHSVVMADVLNCGAKVVLSGTGVVTDDDLVTGFSKHEVLPFIHAIAERMAAASG